MGKLASFPAQIVTELASADSRRGQQGEIIQDYAGFALSFMVVDQLI